MSKIIVDDTLPPTDESKVDEKISNAGSDADELADMVNECRKVSLK